MSIVPNLFVFNNINSAVSPSLLSSNSNATVSWNNPLQSQVEALQEQVTKINSRLAILVPKPEMLKKYEALRTAYNEYKILEALLLEENS